MRSLTLGAIPGPSSAMSTRAHGPSRRVVIVIVPLLAERVDRVVEQVRPHLVELAAVHRQPGQRAVVVAHDVDLDVLELVAEHRRASSPGPRGCRPRRARRDPCTRRTSRRRRARSSAGWTRLSSPASTCAVSDAATQRDRGGRAGPASARDAAQPVAVQAGRGERLGEPPRLRRRRAPRAPRAARPRRRRRRARRAALRRLQRAERLALQRDELLRLRRARSPTRRNARSSRRARRAPRPGRPRRAARRRRVVELVREPGGHRAERCQPLAVLPRSLPTRLTTGRTWRMTRRTPARCAEDELR